MRILVVADIARLRLQVVVAFAGPDGTDIAEAATPQRALSLLDEGETFDVVIADADTAPSGGFFLTREIKARVQMGRTMPPVVVLLARIQDAYLANWAQADAWMLKPVDPFNLVQIVEAVVDGAPVPALPGVGGDPTPSLLDIPT